MNAMIFAAGLGTRLFPLTEHSPKALVQFNGQPLISYALDKAIEAGAIRIVVNVHHFADQIKTYLKQYPNKNVEIIVSDETEQLLETGGGLLFAKKHFIKNEPILILNSDVVTTANLSEMVQLHNQSKCVATLMVADRETQRYFLFNKEGRLCGWENRTTKERIIVTESPNLESWAFNGIQIVNYELLLLLGETRKFSITQGYLNIAAQHPIRSWRNWKGQWFDIGTIDKLNSAETQLKR